jgi:predicted nucleic acid-binding protein
MTTPAFGHAGYDPEQLAARQAAAPAGITDVDANKLLAAMQRMQAQIDQLQAEKAAGLGVPVITNAELMRALLKTHAAHYLGTDHTDVLRLADDTVDAAKNAAESGDGSILTQLAGKMERALKKVNPGPGDFTYFQQARDFATDHIPEAAAQLVPVPQTSAALASSGAATPVIQGSVTG